MGNNHSGAAQTGVVPTETGRHTADYGSPVVLNVYNLQRFKKAGEKSVNQRLGFGFYHSGLEIFGKEWSFGGNPQAAAGQSGVFAAPPKMVLPQDQFLQSITLGVLPLSFTEHHLWQVVKGMEKEWTADSYHLLAHNCNHFTQSLFEALCASAPVKCKKEFPPFVNRAARVADFFVPDALYQSMMSSVPQSNGSGGVQTPPSSSAKATSSKAPPEEQHNVPKDRKELEALSVRQLKTLMWVHGVQAHGCIEKVDLVNRLLEYNEQQRRARQST